MNVDSELELFCMRQAFSVSRTKMYAQALRRTRNWLNRDIVNLAQEDVDTVYRMISGSKNSPWTKRSYWLLARKIIKMFNPRLRVGRLYNANFGARYKLPEEMYSPPEIDFMIQCASSPRNRAVIGVCYELGCRPKEFLNLRIGDINFDAYGAVIILHGKLGPRRLRLVKYANLLREYLTYHAGRADPNAFVFYPLHTGTHRPFSDRNLLDILVQSNARAGISKRIYGYILRHSRATYLSDFLTEQQLCEYFGWAPHSEMPKFYIHRSGKHLDAKMLQVNMIERSAELTGMDPCYIPLEILYKINDMKAAPILQGFKNMEIQEVVR